MDHELHPPEVSFLLIFCLDTVEVGETAPFFGKVLEFCPKVAILQELCMRMNNQEFILHLTQNSSIAALRKD